MVNTANNSSFSDQLPGLQVAIDSTSLGAFKECPRKYQLSIVEGWEPRSRSPHLVFGIALHEAREHYEHAKSGGADHQEALRAALRHAMTLTWNKDLSRPWISEHNLKNRLTLVRTVVWYLDEFGQNDPLETVQLINGKPAVELSFRFDFGHQFESTGEQALLCGHLDRVAALGGEPYVVDLKTSGHSLSASYFNQYSPDNQMSLYTLASKVVYSLDIKGVIIDAAQIAVGFSRFQRGMVPRSEAQIAEWSRDTRWWLELMERAALAEHWPMNDKACGNYGGCPFRPVCSRPPALRAKWLELEYTRRIWDPLKIRGDI